MTLKEFKRERLDFKKNWLRWALDFTQVDLNSLTPVERKKLAPEVVYFCSRDLFEISWEDFSNDPSLSIYRDLLNAKLIEAEENLERVQEALKGVIQAVEKQNPNSGGEIELPETIPAFYVGWEGEPWNEEHPRGEFFLHSIPKDGTLENWGISNLAKLIVDLHLGPHSIRGCKECTRYFLNFTLREKIYCTPICAARSIMRLKYKKLKRNRRKYRAYLKKQNQYGMERYRKKKMEKFGPNVEIRKLVRKKRRANLGLSELSLSSDKN